ncbi:MAG TPA: oligosaccharide flippase family protein [Candidatus Sumerlaeota bacterium]|nr:oligosaccharide flippase family protein [Candidatus Sumerlaeota bacterium]
MSIARDTLAYWLAQAANAALQYLSMAVVAVYLEPELRGVLIGLLLANTMTVSLTHLGLQPTASYFVSRARDAAPGARPSPDHALFLLLIVLITAIDAFLWWAFGSTLFRPALSKIPPEFRAYLLVSLGVIPFSLYLMAGQGMLVGLQRVRQLSRFLFYFNLINSVLSLCGVIWLGWSVPALVTAWAVLQALGAAVLFGLLRPLAPLNFRAGAADLAARLREMSSYGLRGYAGNVAGIIVSRFDQLFVMAARGMHGLGIYQIAPKLSMLIFMPSAALESAGYRQVRVAERAEAARLTRELFRTNFLVNGLLMLALLLLAEPIIRIGLTDLYAGAIVPLRILLPGTLMLSCSRMISLYFSAQLGRPQINSIWAWVAALFYFPMIWWVVIRHEGGLIGAAAVTTACHGILLAGQWLMFMVQTGLWNPAPYLLPQPRDWGRLRRLITETIARRGL